MARKKEILVPHGSIKKICDDMHVAHTTVRSALRGVTDTEYARSIRKRAIDFYGGVLLKS